MGTEIFGPFIGLILVCVALFYGLVFLLLPFFIYDISKKVANIDRNIQNYYKWFYEKLKKEDEK